MTTGLYQFVIQLPAVSGLPEDTCENVLHWSDVGTGLTHDQVADLLVAAVDAFFNDVGTGAAADIASCIGEQITRAANGCSMVLYHKTSYAASAPFGSPVETRSWTLDAATAGLNLPSECAAVNSFHGDLTDVPEQIDNPDPPPAKIRPAARRRGRMYLGPLTTSSGTEDATTHELLLSSGFRNSIVGASGDLRDSINGPNAFWAVYSRTDATAYRIEHGYVDYAFDTQRRRGQAPVARQTW